MIMATFDCESFKWSMRMSKVADHPHPYMPSVTDMVLQNGTLSDPWEGDYIVTASPDGKNIQNKFVESECDTSTDDCDWAEDCF